MVSGEPDFTKRTKSQTDHWYIKGVTLKDPTVAASIPISVENDALAYDAVNDRFKVDIVAQSLSALNTDVSDRWARQVGQVDLARVLGAALSHANPVIARLTDGSAFIDPRDVSDRAARLLGIVYGSEGQQLLQRATTYDLLVQLRHNGVEIDPTQIRALTTSDQITVFQTDETQLKATVTQAAKDRTISSVDAVSTPKQIDLTFTAAGNQTVWTPATGKKIRLKFVSMEVDADVDLGLRFGSTGTIYYLRTTSGVYAANLIGCNIEGAVDETLYVYASGACGVKGYVIGEEV